MIIFINICQICFALFRGVVLLFEISSNGGKHKAMILNEDHGLIKNYNSPINSQYGTNKSKKPVKNITERTILVLIKSFIEIIPKLKTIRYGMYSYGNKMASEQALVARRKGMVEYPKVFATIHMGSEIKAKIAVGVIKKFKPNTMEKIIAKTVMTLLPNLLTISKQT